MDWSNERYCRLYTRDTTTWKLLGWEGQTVLMFLLRKLDRAGRLDLSGCSPVEAIQIHTGLPEDVAERGWDAVTKRHVFVTTGDGCDAIFMPRYVEAQEATATGAERTRRWRERTTIVKNPTHSDESSRAVTPRHESVTDVTPSLAMPSLAMPSRSEGGLTAARVSVIFSEANGGMVFDLNTHRKEFQTIAKRCSKEPDPEAACRRLCEHFWRPDGWALTGGRGKASPFHLAKGIEREFAEMTGDVAAPALTPDQRAELEARRRAVRDRLNTAEALADDRDTDPSVQHLRGEMAKLSERLGQRRAG